VLSTGQESQANCTVVTRVLVVIPQTVHILVSALTITDATSKGPKPAFCFPFNFAHLALGDTLIFLPSSLAGGPLASQ
jgi:hypothetical protein